MVRHLLILFALVMALRVPFWTQAIQGDDIYYLEGAHYAQTNPLHPHQAKYLFQGRLVDMSGHPHPPLNAAVLSILLAVVGDVKEVPFHAAYTLFSLIAVFSMYMMACHFTTQPLLASMLFSVVPAFVVNGNSLECDLPLLAFWMLSMALFVEAIALGQGKHLALAVIPLALTGLSAYQSVVIIPILWLMIYSKRPTWWGAYAIALTPAIILVLYQAFEASSGKAPPLAVTAGYFQEYGLQQLGAKIRNAKALVGHLGWMLFPALPILAFRSQWMVAAGLWSSFEWNPTYLAGVAASIGILKQPGNRFGWWPHLFFISSLILFFAGSARYLLPMAAPVILLTVNQLALQPRWLYFGFAANLLLGLGLAYTNYQHWDGYRDFVKTHQAEIKASRVWVNGELGFRFYPESLGAMPMAQGQSVRPGDLILSSELLMPIPFTVGGGQLVEIDKKEIRTTLPFRLIGLKSKSGYSDATAGVLPFDLSSAPLDRIRLQRVIERKPTLSYFSMGDAEAEQHILSGAYQAEDGKTRWMGKQARLILQSAKDTSDASATVYVPPVAKARMLWLDWNGKRVAELPLTKDGIYTISGKGIKTGMGQGVLTIECDATFSTAGDTRELGVVLVEAGLK